MIVLGIIILAAILVFSIWNWFNLRELKQFHHQNELNDSKYHELKYKMQFLIAMFSVFVVIGGVLGYSSLADARKEIKKEFEPSISSINEKIKSTDKSIREKDSVVRELSLRLEFLLENIPQLDSKAKNQKKGS